MAINSRDKGKRGELELASKLRGYGYPARRTVQYNGKAEEGQADIVGLPGLHIECKRVEKLNLYDAVAQAQRDADGGEIPTVIHRKNDCTWLVTMNLEHFMEIYREWEAGRNQ